MLRIKLKEVVLLQAILISMGMSLLGCAPSLGKSLRVDHIVAQELPISSLGKLDRQRIVVGQFIDERSIETLGRIDGRDLNADGDVGDAVKRAVENQLKAGGANLALFGVPVLSGEIKEWEVSVKPDFPVSEVEALASIRMEVFGDGQLPRYSAIYSGSITTKHPYPTQDKVEETLGEAMSMAIVEALKDERMVAELTSGVVGG